MNLQMTTIILSVTLANNLFIHYYVYTYIFLNCINIGIEYFKSIYWWIQQCVFMNWIFTDQYQNERNGLDGNGLDGNGLDGNGLDGNKLDGN